jgi:hypothetical protein
VTLRLCLGCHRHYRSPEIRNRCPDCGRARPRALTSEASSTSAELSTLAEGESSGEAA